MLSSEHLPYGRDDAYPLSLFAQTKVEQLLLSCCHSPGHAAKIQLESERQVEAASLSLQQHGFSRAERLDIVMVQHNGKHDLPCLP